MPMKKKFMTIFTGWNEHGRYEEILVDGVVVLKVEGVLAVDYRTKGDDNASGGTEVRSRMLHDGTLDRSRRRT